MASKFLSKFVKAATPAPLTTNDNATTETKESKRHSRDRSGSTKSSKSGKSRPPSEDHSSPQRPSFQFGISTLSRAGSRKGTVSTHSAVQDDNTNTPSVKSSGSHRKSESAGAAGPNIPPVPPLPDSLKVGQPTNVGRSRRNSIVSIFGSAGKNRRDSVPVVTVQPPADVSTSRKRKTKAAAAADTHSLDSLDIDIPTVAIVGSPSIESFASNSTRLGVTIIPPSPLIYSGSLSDSPGNAPSVNIEVEPGTPAGSISISLFDEDDQKQEFPEEEPEVEEPEEPEAPGVTVTSTTTTTTTTTATTTTATTNTNAATAAAPTATVQSTSASVLVSIFGRRARTASISSAIGGFITGKSEPTQIAKAPLSDTSAGNQPEESPVTTPTTAATIRPFNFGNERKETIPPVPDIPVSSKAMPPSSQATLTPSSYEVRRKKSSRSMTNVPPPLDIPQDNDNFPSVPIPIRHTRAATSPPDAFDSGLTDPTSNIGSVTMAPIVESPTGIKAPGLPTPASSNGPLRSATMQPNSGSSFLSPRKDDDAASIISTSSKVSPEKKRPWKRSATRKPTGLAGAIAASGLAMANPSMSRFDSQISPIMTNVSSSNSGDGHQPYLSKSPATSVGGKSGKGLTPVSPKSHRSGSSGGRRSSGGGGKSPSASRDGLASAPRRSHHRRPSLSAYSDSASSHGGALSTSGLTEYYSGNESEGALSRISSRGSRGRRNSKLRLDDSSGSETDSEDETDSSDDDSSVDLDNLDLEDDDMPVTGFAVASNKRNADFHELFPNISEADYLIEDYGCALQREILIQGRLYISENHVCFHANIFGWITDLAIPIGEIIALEKKMTAFVIPNAIQITTRQAKYSFASFLSRDTTFDVIYNIWRLSRPDDVQSIGSGRGSLEAGTGSGSLINGVEGGGVGVRAVVNMMNGVDPATTGSKPIVRKATTCACGREGKHYSETALEAVFPGSPEKIHNLIFASGFIKDFLVVDQKLLEIQMSDWMPVPNDPKLLTRNMSYIKPLYASMGPKQTKCEIRDETEHIDFDEYVSTLTTTRTPDVPSGGVFSVKTRTCITWASPVTTKVRVTTQVEWTGRSFIKGIIERSAIDGQKTFHGDLEKAMRNYIQEHKSEFVPEGVDVEASLAAPPALETNAAAIAEIKDGKAAQFGVSEEERNKQREHERNRRAFQWAWDTVEGAFDVAKRSIDGALELVRDAWDQSSSTTILYFVIVILVVSNLYTMVKMGKKEELGRRKEMMKAEERERWVQSVVMTLWDELASGKKDTFALRDAASEKGGPARLQPQKPREEQSPDFSILVLPSTPATLVPSTVSVLDIVATPLPVPIVGTVAWKEELAQLQETLRVVEERVIAIRASIAELENQDQNQNLNQLD
ncbi:hypothetical protein FA15DRAFT_675088 [Coprinopsis marcescibilis]|uniref:VASt domain-containing protein n=1 Tax=Coprinopsis marcescibilis TaxID=230819 RepID=A0A5C3KG04_COPMA|nr:hypothetical protein FA15DRAFT_675088 [Coprinopsis marcescibilis]